MAAKVRRVIGSVVVGLAVVALAAGCAPAFSAGAGAISQVAATAPNGTSATSAPVSPKATPTQPPVGTSIGMQAPDFTLSTIQGQTVHLSEYRGQVVLLNFWATWCPPCRAEIPGLVKAYQQYKGKGFTIVAVNLMEDKDTVTSFAAQQHMDFPVLLDPDGAAGSVFVGRGIPTSYLLDRNGVVRQVVVGSMPEDTISQLVQSLVDSST